MKDSSLVKRNGTTYSNILCDNITIWQREWVITWSLPGKVAHLYEFSLPGHYPGPLPGRFTYLYDFSVHAFDCMVSPSFHTLSRYDFHSNVICPYQVQGY